MIQIIAKRVDDHKNADMVTLGSKSGRLEAICHIDMFWDELDIRALLNDGQAVTLNVSIAEEEDDG